jgi:2-polyprenyl-3-methyl-5-hydroxy-6-metoxy-1,4-benzoquinol methylase
MIKNLILFIAKVFSYFWLIIPTKIRRFLLTSFFILESRNDDRKQSIKNLFLIKDKLDWIINERALKYGNGDHPKHKLTNYHQFFIERIKDGERVLDVGCGNGSVAISIAKSHLNSFVTAIDLNKKNIKFAKEKQKVNNLKNLNFIYGDVNNCSEIASDVVILSNVLEHIENRPSFIKNIQKLSGANIFLIRVPYFKRDWQIAFRKEIGMYYFSDRDHKIEHTLEELKQELKISNLIMNETIIIWGEIWTKCKYGI